MKLINITQNRFIKIVGIILVIYFALFYNKTNPESLGNRLSPKNIKDGLNAAQEKSRFILTNINTAKQIEKQKEKAEGNLQPQIANDQPN
jgi:hypothetical protein